MQPPLTELLELAVEAARFPSDYILSGFRTHRALAQPKYDGSPVTEFDPEAERRIRAFLSERQPGHWPVLGEELGSDGAQQADYRWVVDPIDGTLAFSRGLPTFGTLLAFEEVATSRALIGVIHLPAMGETYSALRGTGAWCNGEAIHVAPDRSLSECIISIPAEHHFRLASMAEGHPELRARAPHLRCYGDCWAHAMVARGSIDVLVELNLSRWDIAATEALVEAAGGRVLVRNAPDSEGKYDAIIGNPRGVAEVASILDF